ncbi:MAG: hypothetical protein NTZ74_15845 [Chloroflexi bacterium]|nr:hypothetical protein [Chloroflexota bacterium]
MLDDLRNSAASVFIDEDPANDDFFEDAGKPKKGPFLGMSAAQRFIIAFFFFLMIAMLGIFVLIVFQKIYIPL